MSASPGSTAAQSGWVAWRRAQAARLRATGRLFVGGRRSGCKRPAVASGGGSGPASGTPSIYGRPLPGHTRESAEVVVKGDHRCPVLQGECGEVGIVDEVASATRRPEEDAQPR